MMLSNGKVAPMNKLPDKEIPNVKELLEYKAKVGCQNCDLIGKGCCSTCVNSLIKQFIELFDRQKAEIERLERQAKADDKYAEALKKGIIVISEKLKTAKAEAYKEFAERLKALSTNEFWNGSKTYKLKVPFVGVDDIDNLLKEMEDE